MKKISLTQGYFALVDDADFERVNAYRWHVRKDGHMRYAARSVQINGVRMVFRLHTFLTGSKRTDHKDGNGLNNQRANLRPADARLNGRGFNTKRAGASSKFRGVSWYKRDALWTAQIELNGKRHLGRFEVEEAAARAYDAAAREHFGDFATPNFP